MRRPFQDSYPAKLGTALLALVPFIVLTTAESLFRHQVMAATGVGRTELQVVYGLAIAAYAFGALLGGHLIQRFRQRSLFLLCESAFVAASLLAACAWNPAAYGAGVTAEGAATGLLLVIALPPVVRRFPAARHPGTAAAVDVGFFGAVAAGPLVGGAVALLGGWRWFFVTLAGAGAVAFALGWLTLESRPPPNPEMRLDRSAILLGVAATFLPFWATGELTGHGFGSLLFILPLLVGVACFMVLLLVEYHKDDPLSPVERVWNPFPALGGLFRTRWLPVLTLGGRVVILVGGSVLLTLPSSGSAGARLGVAAALLGFGAGATVAPGLWMVGFSLPSKMVGRTFALIELVRSEADFIFAPVMLEIATVASAGGTTGPEGIRGALLVTLAVGGAITAASVVVYLAKGPGLPAPDVEGWLEGDRSAL